MMRGDHDLFSAGLGPAFTKKKVVLASLLGRAEVLAYTMSNLCIHRSITKLGYWSVSHIGTGRMMSDHASLKSCMRIALAVDSEPGWSSLKGFGAACEWTKKDRSTIMTKLIAAVALEDDVIVATTASPEHPPVKMIEPNQHPFGDFKN